MSTSLSGRRIGSFDVGPLIGAGGMGEVYRGRDTALNRDVAIKVLLPAVAGDSERLARFNREAQVLASLNHPNIAHIHGISESESGPLLILEFVGGPTLADRVAQGPLPVDEAIAIAKQIADALEAAHERGIIHRDLKPANIKVDDHGTVKVLDFGLAKAIDPGAGSREPGGGDVANSPTITSPAMTQAGLILGTAAYMSPEQAKGRVVDKRSDVWAFGCVLYEMLTGTRAFEGEDVTDTIAAVVRGEPDWTRLPSNTPKQIRLLLRKCLDKDRRTRISDIGVAQFLMNESIEGESAAPAAVAPSRRPLAYAAGGLILGVALVAAVWMLAPARTPAVDKPVRFAYTPSAAHPLVLQGNDHDVAIAPDGSFVVYRSGDLDLMRSRLMIRSIDETEARDLTAANNARHPFVSPDGKWVGFFVGAEMRKVPVAGGAPVLICRVGGAPRGASWGDDDHIVFATGDSSALSRVAAAGGEPQVLIESDKERREQIGNPHVLPGGKTVLFTTYTGSDFLSVAVHALDVATGSRKIVLSAAADASFIDPGYLVFATINASSDAQSRFRAELRAVRFDAAKVETMGDAATLVDPVAMGTTGAANYSTSRRGDLVYVPGAGPAAVATRQRTLVWVGRDGRETAIAAPPRAYAVARLSPDGTRIALDVRDQTNDIWIWDINRRGLSLLSRDPAQDMSPNWTRDSAKIVWTSTRAGGNPNLYWMSADGAGAPERLTTSATNQFPTAIAADDRTVFVFGAGGSLTDIFTVRLDEPGRDQKPLLAVPSAYEFGPEISPDGKWLAYHSNESGEFQVYVRPFPNVDAGRWQVSTNGGSRAAWTSKGRELTYLSKDGVMMSVAVQAAGTTLSIGSPATLFKSPYFPGSTVLGLDLRGYDVTPDGQRFVMIKQPADAGSPNLASMVVVVNWAAEVKSRLPTP